MKLLLVDGSYYAYRSFHAIRELSNSAGEPVNALFGFAKALRRMLKDLKPDLAACVWDDGLPARRTELQPGYKAHRADMPDLMKPQMPQIRGVTISPACGSLPLRMISKPRNIEASVQAFVTVPPLSRVTRRSRVPSTRPSGLM